MVKILKILNLVDKYLLLSLIFLYPLFFLPFFASAFDTPKLLILTVFVLLVSIIKIAKTLMLGDFRINISKIDLLVVGLAVVYLVSGILFANKMDAFFFPGTASFAILGSILYFFVRQFEENDRKLISISLSLSAVIYAIITILSFVGVLKGSITPFGNIISSFSFLIITLFVIAFEIIKNKNFKLKIFFSVSAFIVFVGTATSFYSLMPRKDFLSVLPSVKSSWSIAIDSLKESPLLGVGPSNFLYSYNKFRPITNNSDKNWEVKYLVSSNMFLNVVTEIGLIGLILYVSLFVVSVRKINFSKLLSLDVYEVSLLLLLVLFLVLPFSASFLPFVFLIFALNNNPKEVSGIFNSKIPLFLISLPFIGIVVMGVIWSYKVFYPEYLFSKALTLVSKNEAIKAYEGINKAVNGNQYVDRYHLASAQINMAIAQGLSQKENLTDADKKTLSELIQQAIRESKAVASLSPNKSSSWENLGNVYVAIAPFAQNANDFAIQSYNQAISLDPINPLIRIKLGGIYYSNGKYQDAVKVFELAVLAKPDHANSHFNLAMAYKGNEELEKAKAQMDIVLKLVDPNSKDYQLAKQEFDTMDSKVNEKPVKPTEETVAPEQTESLTPPVESPLPAAEPQVEIPQ